MTAESPRKFLIRFFAPALALTGVALLLVGLAGNSEAQERTRDTRAGFTLEFAGGKPDYRSSDLCARLSGEIVQVTVGVLPVCADIDTDGTFCIAGSRDAFPCRGLYRKVLLCNQYNRPAQNPFICEAECSGEDEFACGGKCWRGRIRAAGRIPYVVPGHVGDVFQAEVVRTSSGTTSVTVALGEGLFSMSPSAFTVNATNGTVGVSAALSAGGEYAATLRADFVCGGLWKTFAEGEWAFTVTALAATPAATVYLEGGEGTGTGTVTINGIGQLSFESASPFGDRVLDIAPGGEISVVEDLRPAIGTERTFTVRATSPEVAGTIPLTVVVKFRHPFDSNLGANHCSAPADSDSAREDASCPASGYCEAVDGKLLDALETDGDKGDSDFCSALRNGADVNALDSNGDYPLGLAAKMDRFDLGERLTMHGASLSNDESEFGNPSNYAALAGSAKFMRWLLATVGIDVDEKSGSGYEYAPVHILGLRDLDGPGDSEAVARLLTMYNADLDADSPFAADDDSRPLPYRYIDHLTDPGDPPDHRPLRIFLEAGMDVSRAHPAGDYVPIARAVQNNHTLVLSVLLDYDDADRASPVDLTTPLFHARSPEAVRLLHDAGADLNVHIAISGTVFQTPLDVMIAALVGGPDENLRLAVSLLAELGGKCLATLSDSETKSHCPNTGIVEDAECEHPDSPDPSGGYTLMCELTCAVGNDTGWDCPVSADDYVSHTLEEIENDCKGHPDAASACFL